MSSNDAPLTLAQARKMPKPVRNRIILTDGEPVNVGGDSAECVFISAAEYYGGGYPREYRALYKRLAGFDPPSGFVAPWWRRAWRWLRPLTTPKR